MEDFDARRAIEIAARDSYGRLIAFLAARSRDVSAAEDALADAFASALEHWPRNGIPDKPEAWLLTAARNRMTDARRHACVRSEAVPALLMIADEAHAMADSNISFPDERLKLLFICAHPAIEAPARTPLMLQTLLGLGAVRIGSALLVQPAAMGQRLARAKRKIRDAGIGFEVPTAKELPARLEAVLEAIYAAYGSGWDDVAGADPRRKGLALEAIGLCRMLLQLMPGQPEVMGLLALMLYCESRHKARRSATGEYVPLLEQDTARWSRPMINSAEQLLKAAAHSGLIGSFQLEAAIQSAHAQRIKTGHTDWEAIALLYEGLVVHAPTIGALVGRAAAVAEARDAAVGWALLEAIPAESVKSYQPYWALAAHLLARLQRIDEARVAYGRAIGLCEDPAMREFLTRRLEALPVEPTK
ncbi:RNA polymerase subunit sigma-70 [Phyllobacterium sp. LjRoot231]|uniref:RNA polymerase sigma factor n=1 Tax=Phyllobacterium sp. LjRoot231 TaxID=3342289 RepID=UPI003ECF043C